MWQCVPRDYAALMAGIHAWCALLLGMKFVGAAYVPPEVCKVYNSSGDVYIGGVFSLHDDREGAGSDEGCGGLLPVSALQVVEAMVFAVRAINDDRDILPDVTLGFEIHDDCSRDGYAMWGALALVMGAQAQQEGESCKIPGVLDANRGMHLVGIVGTGQTSSTDAVASTNGLFRKPLISYGSTGHAPVDDDDSTLYFTTLSDRLKAITMVDVLEYFQWTYVAVVFTGDAQSRRLMSLVWEETERRDDYLCVEHARVLLSEIPTEEDLETMVGVLREHEYVTVALLMASSAETYNAVFKATERADPPLNMTWLVSEPLVDDTTLQDGLAQGSIFIDYHKPELLQFERHFRSLTSASTDNPWYDEFCGGPDRCLNSSREGFSTSIPTLAPTMDAVMALAHALNKTIRESDGHDSIPKHLDSFVNQRALLSNLESVSFQGTRGVFGFENKVAQTRFILSNVQEIDGEYQKREFGFSSLSGRRRQESMRLTINDSLIQWRGKSDGPPRSVCREICSQGEVLVKSERMPCCWECRHCSADEIAADAECQKCNQTQWPDANQTTCVDLTPQGVDLTDPVAVALAFLSSLGLLLCAVAGLGIVRYREHRVIKAGSRELSFVNIGGLVVCFCTVIAVLHPPRPATCAVCQCMFLVSFTLNYASLFLKVHRLYRIFRDGAKTAKTLRFIGPKAQLTFLTIPVLIQVLLIAITGIAVPGTWTSIRHLFPTPPENQPRTLEIFCQFGTGFLVTMAYNALIVLACCLYAYKARNVPGNYSEAKFYAASVYTTVVLSVAALPVYLTGETAIALTVSVSLVLIMNGYVTLTCVYLPKLYAVTFNKVRDDSGGTGTSNENTTRNRSVFLSGPTTSNMVVSVSPTVK